MRPGTENLPAIWSLSEAAVRACESLERHREDAVSLKRRLVSGVEQIEGARFVPMRAEEDEERYSPFILSVAFPPLPGEVLVRVLNDAGVAVSMGSACSARQTKERRVLSGMGVDAETARSAIRISTGYATTSDEVDRFLETLQKEVHRWSTPLRA